jgi:hypothetical protein
VQNAAQIYLAPGRHPVISAIAPELASCFAHILTEPLPENLAALLQQLDAKLSAAQTCRRRTGILHNQNRKTASRGGLSEIRIATNAPQRKASLFDHLVGDGEYRGWHSEVK